MLTSLRTKTTFINQEPFIIGATTTDTTKMNTREAFSYSFVTIVLSPAVPRRAAAQQKQRPKCKNMEIEAE